MFLTTTYEDGSQTEELLYWWCNNSGNYEPNNQDQQGPDHGSSGGDPNDEMAACKPCIPAAGSWGYVYHSAANGNDPHYGMANHTHHYQVNQKPATASNDPCKCFWNRDAINPTEGLSPKPNAVQINENNPVPAGGGLK